MTGAFHKTSGAKQSKRDRAEHWIGKFGSREAIESDTPRETMIEQALAPYAVKAIYVDPQTKEVSHYIEYRGLETEPMTFEDLEPHIVEAVSRAYPIPPDLRGVLQEHKEWDELGQARHCVCGWGLPVGALARELILENALHSRPSVTTDDIKVRVGWLVSRATYEFDLGHDIIHRLHGQLERDFSAVCASPGRDRAPAQRAGLLGRLRGGGQ